MSPSLTYQALFGGKHSRDQYPGDLNNCLASVSLYALAFKTNQKILLSFCLLFVSVGLHVHVVMGAWPSALDIFS